MARYSRLANIEEKRNVRTAIIFGGLTLFIIIFGLLYGIPLVARFATFLSSIKGGNQTVDTSNLPPPPPPQFSTLPEFTNQQSLHVEGTTQPGNTVNIYFNDQPKAAVADSSGKFSGNYSLVKGSNTIWANAKNKGGESGPSTKYTIVYDTMPPKLEIVTPHEGDNFYTDKQKEITIEGKTDPEASVTVNEHLAIVGNDGSFRISYDLNSGENTLTITATDKAGNKKELSLKVNFTP